MCNHCNHTYSNINSSPPSVKQEMKQKDKLPELGVEARLWLVKGASPSGNTILQKPKKKKRWDQIMISCCSREELNKHQWGNLHVSGVFSIALIVYVIRSCKKQQPNSSSITLTSQRATQIGRVINSFLPPVTTPTREFTLDSNRVKTNKFQEQQYHVVRSPKSRSTSPKSRNM